MILRSLLVAAAFATAPGTAAEAGDDALFAKYPAGPVFNRKPSKVDIASHKDGRIFRSRLRAAAAKGPNFAGHMTVVEIGCGTMCQVIMVVDARHGMVYAPLPSPASLGVDFKLGSRLLVVNPPENIRETPNAKELGVTTEYYVWNDGKLSKLPKP
jgi:hypothetical protein